MLGNLLRLRYGSSGRIADLHEAVARGREAVAAGGTGGAPAPMSNLANALEARYERTGQLADLDEAIARYEAAVAWTPSGHVDRAV